MVKSILSGAKIRLFPETSKLFMDLMAHNEWFFAQKNIFLAKSLEVIEKKHIFASF